MGGFVEKEKSYKERQMSNKSMFNYTQMNNDVKRRGKIQISFMMNQTK